MQEKQIDTLCFGENRIVEFSESVENLYKIIAKDDTFSDNAHASSVREAFAPIGIFSASLLLALRQQKQTDGNR